MAERTENLSDRDLYLEIGERIVTEMEQECDNNGTHLSDLNIDDYADDLDTVAYSMKEMITSIHRTRSNNT